MIATPTRSPLGTRPIVVTVAMAVLLAQAGTRAQEAASPAPLASRIQSLAEDVLKRVDAEDELRKALSENERELGRLRVALVEAEASQTIAEIAIREYLEGTFPQELQTLQAAVKLAQAELTRATDRLAGSTKAAETIAIDEDQLVGDRLKVQKAELQIKDAISRLEILQRYTKARRLTELEAALKKAESLKFAAEAEFQLASARIKAGEKRLAHVGPSPGDRRALAALDDAFGLLDGGKPRDAEARLADARRIWDGEQRRRAEERLAAMKARIRAAGDRGDAEGAK